MATRKRRGRRARGTGSVFFHAGRGRWVARKVVNGVKIERWGETQREAVDKLAEALPPDPDSITVAQWATRWQQTWTTRPSTRDSYGISLSKHLLPALGNLRLVDVNTGHIEGFISRLLETVAGSTARTIMAHICALFQAAVRADLIPRNVAALARKPRHVPTPIEVYTAEQLARIVAAAPQFKAGGVIATLAGTGCRVGEALALDIGDWCRAKGTLTITRTYSLQYGLGPVKSRHSRRTISVPDILSPVLDAAVGGRTEGPLFTTERGNRRCAQMTRKAWTYLLRHAGLPSKKLHALRHSVATLLIAKQVPVPDVAKYLGDTVATLVRCYVHASYTNPSHCLNSVFELVKVNPAPLGGQRVGEVPVAAATPEPVMVIAG
jgi:integrase